jgi:hypothetical protein
MRRPVRLQQLSFKLVATAWFALMSVLSLPAQMPVPTPTPTVTNPDAAGLNIFARPGQWSTSDGSPVDVACTQGETEIVDASGGRLCVIGTHGNIGVIQCMPPNGVFAGSGAQQLLCSVCFAGSPTTASGEGSVAQCLAQMQGVPCENVIACTGPQAPIGNNPSGCAETRCYGVWVNGCTPPVAITPSTPGVCYTTGPPQPPSAPVANKVTVGCFASDLPSDMWQRCRSGYNNFVTISRPWPLPDRTCADEWANADPSSQGFQACQALVRSCLANTRASCAAVQVAQMRRLKDRLNAPAPLWTRGELSRQATEDDHVRHDAGGPTGRAETSQPAVNFEQRN